MLVAQRMTQSIRFSGRSFLAFVLTPEAPLDGWMAAFDAWKAGSPQFFDKKLVVLNLGAIELDRDGLGRLLAAFAQRNVRIVGLEVVDESILGPGSPPVLTGGRAALDEVAKMRVSDAPAVVPPLLIEQLLRSGRSIFHAGDVTIVGGVASGAEVVAGGSIHVYGALRGRAIAGSAGDSRARIFCQKLEAEFVSINGQYKITEDFAPELLRKPVQIVLRENSLDITAIR